jgi:hypothetical protein
MEILGSLAGRFKFALGISTSFEGVISPDPKH